MSGFISWLKDITHIHKWVVFRTVELVKDPESLPHGFSYHLQCKVCGKIKVKSLYS